MTPQIQPWQTSLEAYHYIQKTLGERQKQVYDCLKQLGEATNTMIAKAMMLPINCVVPRVFELRHYGYVTVSRIDKCVITKHSAIWWRCTRKK